MKIICTAMATISLTAVGTVGFASPTVSLPGTLVGSYFVHAGGLTARPNGTITVGYPHYATPPKPPSFPQLTLRTTRVSGATAFGRVVRSADPRVVRGTSFVLRTGWPGVVLKIKGKPRMGFCDEYNKAQGECGA